VTLDASERSSFLDTAIDSVRRAGQLQREAFGGNFRVDKKGTIDLVTEVDVAAEKMIRALIAERHPSHAVLGEEMGGPTTPASRIWMCDPIDGTTNFAHGLPIFCCSIALEVDGELEVAAVYDPMRDELFTATRGGGAFLNGVQLSVSHTATLIDALLVTGFPYTMQQRLEEMVALFAQFLSESRAVRRLGSAALDLCYVAAGRFDGFWEQGLNAWDIAAGVLLVREAGGRVTDLVGGTFDVREGRILATNGALHADMARLIAGHQKSHPPA
jgi:myo-inositol-1(or 4)-monophosphatase